MKTLVFLDDLRYKDDVTWIKYPEYFQLKTLRNFEQFKSHIDSLSALDIENSIFSFDHDLGDFNQNNYELNGMTCCKYLVDKCIDLNVNYINFVVHSFNPVGKENIESYINQYNNSFI